MDRNRTRGTSVVATGAAGDVVIRDMRAIARPAAVALAIAFAGVAACETQTAERAADQTTGGAAGPAAEVTPGQDTAPMAAEPVATQQIVTVRVTDGGISVEPTTVRPGATTFRVTNETSSPYDIDIDGPGPDREIENLPPGATRDVSMTLRAGTYEIEANEEREPERERSAYITVRE